ncbi:mitochondrial hydrogen/potassium transport system protein [Schizosaccharomyces osmophilus]|uniref:Mitochondrial hydrogen/potassium transport system protein n=1 Tax=Schizosaccharomyces osmophilus TaxID=2545709 RepID=A0AAE9WG58_9SCHI|nr:mitochondrial hydrogen/potassium transport system protein [Schizosaccharomyces osmophilus]WBW74183.1 mitochondrial hydrogen/potassium transport system protein [Schizosaccharomyces osmophilus]
MKIIALPLPKQRVFLHCYPSEILLKKVTIHDRIINRIYNTWDAWSKSKSYIRQKTVSLGNSVLHRTSHEESFLRSLSSAKKLNDKEFYSSTVIERPDSLEPNRIFQELIRLQEMKRLHRNNLIANIVGLPLTIPFILVPIVPNVPGFYLCYRAYCNYRALIGASQITRLLDNKELQIQSNEKIELAYRSYLDGDHHKLNEAVGHQEFSDRYERAIEQELKSSKNQ